MAGSEGLFHHKVYRVMSELKVLRFKIYQPHAHYRIPFTYQRRHTYPIPPYSTVVGFLCNLLGYRDKMPADIPEIKKLKMSVAGQFGCKTTEFLWFRNLSKDAHLKRFGTLESRHISGHIEHIGGQSPMMIDTLNDVRLVIHLAHEDEGFLEEIRDSLQNPVRRLEPLHLGRAEDWIVLMDPPEIFDLSKLSVRKEDGNYGYFFWIPKNMFVLNSEKRASRFEDFDGLLYRLTSLWTVENYAETLNRHGRRIFTYITAKLSDGLFTDKFFLFDDDKDWELPVFLADLGDGS
jgi:CRISPR-associated protein Cas5t